MEVIHLIHPYQTDQIPADRVVLALGFFDGVHLGHQTVIQRARAEADRRNLPLALMTFNQQPRIVYGGINPKTYKYLSTNDRKMTLLEDLKVDIVYMIDYTYSFGHQAPEEFVQNYIVDINADVVVAGSDYTYGKADIANMKTLPAHADGRFDIVTVDLLKSLNRKISTTEIKNDLSSGNIERANRDLGYIYENYGTVIHGEKVGRKIGFPTANVQVNHPQLLPAVGVYAVEFWVSGRWYLGAASIGYNVTLYNDHNLTCEVYIIDYDEFIYGEKVKVRWHHYLRGEIKFDSMDGLIEQLHKDEENTRKYFAETSKLGMTS